MADNVLNQLDQLYQIQDEIREVISYLRFLAKGTDTVGNDKVADRLYECVYTLTTQINHLTELRGSLVTGYIAETEDRNKSLFSSLITGIELVNETDE